MTTNPRAGRDLARRIWQVVKRHRRLARIVGRPAKFVWRLTEPVSRGAPWTAPGWLFPARDWRHARGTILLVDDKLPEFDRHAGGLFIYQVLRILVDNDFRVLFLPHDRVARQPYAAILQQSGIEVLSGDLDATSWLTVNGKYLDWVLLARPAVATAFLGPVKAHTRARLVYYTVDLHFLRELRRYETTGDTEALRESRRLRSIETEIIRAVDWVLTPSTDEARMIDELVPGCKARVLAPYVMAQSAHSHELRPLADRDQLLFVGGFAHPPNVDAVRLLVEEIMPAVWRRVPRARVMLVGTDPPEEIRALSSDRVVVVGYVPDLEPYYARARASVSPLRFGAGVKGKIIESLAAGVPVVTTTIGNEGIGLIDGVDGLIADEPEQIAAHVIRLFEDHKLLESLAAAGRNVIAARFSEARARDIMFEALGLPLEGARVAG